MKMNNYEIIITFLCFFLLIVSGIFFSGYTNIKKEMNYKNFVMREIDNCGGK